MVHIRALGFTGAPVHKYILGVISFSVHSSSQVFNFPMARNSLMGFSILMARKVHKGFIQIDGGSM